MHRGVAKRKHDKITNPSAIPLKSRNTPDDVDTTADICGTYPQLLARALSTTNSLHSQSAHINSDGWAYVCADNQLYLWKYLWRRDPHAQPECYVFDLPPLVSGSWDSSLVCLWERKKKPPSLMVVTPDGNGKYWPDIRSQDRPPCALSLPNLLPDEQVTKLVSSGMNEPGFVAGTSTGDLYEVQFSRSRWLLEFRKFEANQGFKHSMTKTLNMFGIGTNQNESTGSVQTMLLPTDWKNVGGVDAGYLYVLTETSLQAWTVSSDAPSLKHSMPLLQEIVSKEGGTVTLLDIKSLRSGALLLLVRSENEQSFVRYKMYEVDCERWKATLVRLDADVCTPTSPSGAGAGAALTVIPGENDDVIAYVHFPDTTLGNLHLCGARIESSRIAEGKSIRLLVNHEISRVKLLGVTSVKSRNALLLLCKDNGIIRVEVSEKPVGKKNKPAEAAMRSGASQSEKERFKEGLSKLFEEYHASAGDWGVALDEAVRHQVVGMFRYH